MHPSLSDCPGMGADVPRRIDLISDADNKNLLKRTARIDGFQAVALRLSNL
jgi:hypothetical protein